ncbi:MAG: hypothetical protein JKX69_11530 [Rhodobacteraceae bacterium]|nr:hypothetical protein [Paracoccaceae bacterium]
MPELIRFYIRNVAIGFAISAGFVGCLLWFNVAGLGNLVMHSSDGILAGFLLWLFNGIVFAGVQFAVAIMLMADPKSPSAGGKARQVFQGLAMPVAIPVRDEVKPHEQGHVVRRDRL